ncbi:hypothetical protein F2Q70_00002051 [Brassica cretica]|uniref:Secreted protein n=1 Tax=Brassica cretica TaxID=69181 RepID=A0A8S9IUF9_BRACR|nr:hypothetical protein F2Q70_00002051 [Brassica cretica]
MWVVVAVCIFVVAPAVDLMPQFLGSVQFRIASGRSHCWFSAVSACGEFLLSVLSPELGKFLWQHVTSHGTASASPWWSLSSEVGLLIVAARVSLSLGLHASLKVVLVWWSNLHFLVPNDGTTCQWTPPRAASLCLVQQGLRVPLSPGARGNLRFSPLIPPCWTIDVTLPPVHLDDLSSL